MKNNENFALHVISYNVRFGFGYRTLNGEKQYFAWHGSPNRNDDYFKTAEISKTEYEEIKEEYPKEFAGGKADGEAFYKKYIDAHTILLEGWNELFSEKDSEQ